MRISITIESDGVETEVSRTFESAVIEERNASNHIVSLHETPPLAEVAAEVARSAANIHRLTH